MSAGVEDSDGGTARTGTAGTGTAGTGTAHTGAGRDDIGHPGPGRTGTGLVPAAPAESPTTAAGSKTAKHHHHVLIEPDEDRWAWRRRIRQNPHKLRMYRVAVGFAGLLLICLGLVTGPLPGPGGIPLVLLGLAIWSSEFEWAYRLRQRFKAEIRKFRGWTTRRKVAFWAVFCAVCASLGYGYLLVLGVPFWMPEVGAVLLEQLPGVHEQR
jgi:uncharacterized protein (TIGR02611 family)